MREHFRKCPNCKKKGVEPSALPAGATCLGCGEIVEIDAKVALVVPAVLLLLCLGSFRLGEPTLGILMVLANVLYASQCERINSIYLPLKIYRH